MQFNQLWRFKKKHKYFSKHGLLETNGLGGPRLRSGMYLDIMHLPPQYHYKIPLGQMVFRCKTRFQNFHKTYLKKNFRFKEIPPPALRILRIQRKKILF